MKYEYGLPMVYVSLPMATVVVVSPSCKLRLAKSIVFWGRGGPGGRRLLALVLPSDPHGEDILTSFFTLLPWPLSLFIFRTTQCFVQARLE